MGALKTLFSTGLFEFSPLTFVPTFFYSLFEKAPASAIGGAIYAQWKIGLGRVWSQRDRDIEQKGGSKKPIEIMDPDCAICSQPALAQCECEAKGLDIAVRQAEQRMMTSVFNDIRAWVRGHAQDYILSYFSMLTTRRKDHHAQTIHRITERAAYYYRARPHPSEIAAADAELKRGIDEDWKASVQRYPEVLEYFYGLVDLNLPGDEEPGVRDPPLSALGGVAVGRERERKVRLRESSEVEERRRHRRRSRGRDEIERERERERDRVRLERAEVPLPPSLSRERVRPGPVYAPPMGGYGYVQPQF